MEFRKPNMMCHYIHTRVNIVTGTEVSYDLRLISRPVLLSTLQMFIPVYFVAIDTCTPREVLLRRLKRCPVEVSGPLLWPLVGSRSPTLITCWKMSEYIGWCIRVDFERALLVIKSSSRVRPVEKTMCPHSILDEFGVEDGWEENILKEVHCDGMEWSGTARCSTALITSIFLTNLFLRVQA